MDDKYFIAMSNFIMKELKEQKLDNVLDQNQVSFLANNDMFIIDAYKIIEKIKEYTVQYKRNKLDCDEFKKIVNDYFNN